MIEKEDVNQLELIFDGRYRKIEDCDDITEAVEKRVELTKGEIADMKLAFREFSVKLNVLIAILSAIAVPVLGICIQNLFKR